MTEIKGYVVSSRKVPDGRYYEFKTDAIHEMLRQTRLKGNGESGMREVYKAEWESEYAQKRKNILEIEA